MTSRDLVVNTLEFASPERIPRQLWLLPWASDHRPEAVARIARDYPDDIVAAPACLREQLKTVGDPYLVGTYMDEWGCTFENRQRGVIGEVKYLVFKTWEDLFR